jgi:hypothetical protein
MTTKPAKMPGTGDTVEDASVSDAAVLTISAADLDALIAKRVAEAMAPKMASTTRDADLPNEGDIDTKTIKSPVLSKTGWVLPDGYGVPMTDGAVRK